MKRKKLITLFAVMAMTASLMAGCSGGEEPSGQQQGGFESQPIVSVVDDPNTSTPVTADPDS